MAKMAKMSKRREEFLAVINENNQHDFIAFVKLHNSRNDPFNVAEVIQSLSRQQFEEMWCGLSDMCTEVLTCFDVEQDDSGSPQAEDAKRHDEVLAGITTMALCSISVQEPTIIGPLIQVAVMLHGVMLALPESSGKLQFSIAHLCEIWFLAGLDGKDELVTSMLPYFIIKSLGQGMVSDNLF